MPLLILLLTLTTSAFAAEVATLETTKSNELLLVMTDEALQASVDKNYLAQTCRPRTNINGTLKEYYFLNSCRAELTKFLLNSGYKPDQIFRTFVK